MNKVLIKYTCKNKNKITNCKNPLRSVCKSLLCVKTHMIINLKENLINY